MKHTISLAATLAAIAASATAPGLAADHGAAVLQGGMARWSLVDAKECGIFGRRYAAVDGVCYFPVDMKAKPGVTEIALWDTKGARTLGTLTVSERECSETEITLGDATYMKVSDENAARSREERARIVKAVAGAAGDPGFVLPLGAPAEGVATNDPTDFCELRVYNGGLVKSRHTGLDYPLPEGTPVVAGADGTVTLAADQFYTGNTVVVDHGGGLVTMVFHLKDVAVEQGATVKRGDRLGTVGSTGRSTGPHLHFGARYQNQRIDAGALIGDPATLSGVGEAPPLSADAAAAAADGGRPGSENAAPSVGAETAVDAGVRKGQPTRYAGDPESADIADPQEDAIEAEAEAQEKADEAAKFQ